MWNDTESILRKQVVDDPLDDSIKGILADYLEENAASPAAMEEVKVLRAGLMPLSNLDIKASLALTGRRLLVAERQIVEMALGSISSVHVSYITPEEYLWLWCMVRKYRKRIRSPILWDEGNQRYDLYCQLLGIDKRVPRKRVPDENTVQGMLMLRKKITIKNCERAYR